MTMHPSRMMPGPHAVELQDAGGEVVAMLWTHKGGMEVICERGYAADFEVVCENPFRLTVHVNRTSGGVTVDRARPRGMPRA
jgi:hypothetical protein